MGEKERMGTLHHREKTNKYYFYYTAEKQVGVAVADHPLGPFKDSGQPLIGKGLPGGMKRGQNIDPDVFTDPVSGKTYLYWGNYYMAVCELNDDMVSVKPNTTKILIDNDRHYSEAPYVFYRDGYYYFTWSKNDTRSADYEVRYVRSKSPVGPIDPSKSRVVVCKVLPASARHGRMVHRLPPLQVPRRHHDGA